MEQKIKYLEMIQQVINRMAQNSFTLKGWAVTLLAALFALAAKDSNLSFFLIAYIPICVFWILDSYYLQLERKYRLKYNEVKLLDENSKIDFDLTPPDSEKSEKTTLFDCLKSPVELYFYLSFALLILIIVIITKIYFKA